MNHKATKRNREGVSVKNKGFTLIEVIILLAIFALGSAIVVPRLLPQITTVREKDTLKEMEKIHQTLFGHPKLGTYGYLGDLGGLPSTLPNLNTNPGLPDYSLEHTNGVGMGWNGPYMNSDFFSDGYLIDAWGNEYSYNSTTGQLTSSGPDGQAGGGDDLVYPTTPEVLAGDLRVIVQAENIQNPGAVRTLDQDTAKVTIYFAENGSEQAAGAQWNDNAFDTTQWAKPLPPGLHAVYVEGKNGPLLPPAEPPGKGKDKEQPKDPDDYSGRKALVSVPVSSDVTTVTIFIQ